MGSQHSQQTEDVKVGETAQEAGERGQSGLGPCCSVNRIKKKGTEAGRELETEKGPLPLLTLTLVSRAPSSSRTRSLLSMCMMGPWSRVLSEREWSEDPPAPVPDPKGPQLDSGGQAGGTWGLNSGKQKALGTYWI